MEFYILLSQAGLLAGAAGFTIHALNTKKSSDTLMAAWWWGCFWINFRGA